jgi:broad specificity phosphatase PhoE
VAVVQIFLIRHGETALNAAGLLRGQIDVPLDDKGREQAAALGAAFAEVPLASVVSSPLVRALDTARPVASASGGTLTVDERLSDRFYGELAGQSLAKAEERFGSIDAAPLVEAWHLLERRAGEAFSEAAEAAADAGRPVALVTHDAVLKALLGLLAPATASVRLELPTGSFSELFAPSPDGPWAAPRVGQLPALGARP